ncbi:MAG TPA: PAS domain-containing protein [Candidatus Cybelea sp.]|nr:PAS domain-containing protein [Candidatus Cybelea sp.]
MERGGPQQQVGDSLGGRYRYISLDECTSDKVRRLLNYWQRIRGDRAMPRRQDVDPAAIWPLLKNVFMNEWHTKPDRLHYRIAGTELVAAMGFEIRGKWLTDLYHDPADVERTLTLYRKVVDGCAPVLGRTEGTQLRLGVETFEWVICPLSDDGTHVTHFIGLEDYVATRPYLGAPE